MLLVVQKTAALQNRPEFLARRLLTMAVELGFKNLGFRSLKKL